MRRIYGKLTEELKAFIGNEDVSSHEGLFVNTYSELQVQMAKLSCINKNYTLYYRGQHRDYKAIDSKSQRSSFYPTIFRGKLSADEKEIRWNQLEYASKKLVEYLKTKGIVSSSLKMIERKQLLQWSILQHYEVVPTPLIDVTQSLRVACSFALLDNPEGHAYVYAFALPYVNHRISIDSEAYLTNIRLLSIAPPEALRPYHQEGFLVGEDFIQREYSNKEELDLNNRLIAKFIIPNDSSFWDIESILNKSILYPENDLVDMACREIRDEIKRVFAHADGYNISAFISTPEFMSFISHWVEIEKVLKTLYSRKKRGEDGRTPISTIIKELDLSDTLKRQLLRTNYVRNIVIHDPSSFKPNMAATMKNIPNLEFELKHELKW